MNKRKQSFGHKKEKGAVLMVSLVMLILLSLISIGSMNTSIMEEKMAGNMRDQNLAFQAAESVLIHAESSLSPTPTFSDIGANGLYSQSSTIPTLTNVLTQGFWSSNPTATYDAESLGNNISNAHYIIKQIKGTCVSSTLPCPSSDQRKNYRVVVRATGGSNSAVVILQTVYQVNA